MKKRKILEGILLSYLLTSIDVIGGFQTHFNLLNWDYNRFFKLIILFIIILSVEHFISKKKNN
ncbi:hypothetical protein N9326_01715 [Flavobacteriaceae bacterium]|jgi:hypothetical protein|nr:hypothetical protein [Flavobacteriaceae bacterium]MDA9338892.1 hypothetical protein [Flavobacteriaceae bacterium]MDA9362246.1 hypothetical protein [Flavobacteriaceae bacterium]MDB3901206.1 hypothetical protein [Flavobacteriaceae bacterium]MDB4093795.1 hypothetical protein [Flavobacteriaceae bacterium]